MVDFREHSYSPVRQPRSAIVKGAIPRQKAAVVSVNHGLTRPALRTSTMVKPAARKGTVKRVLKEW